MGDSTLTVASVIGFVLIGFVIGLVLIRIVPEIVNFVARDNEKAVSDLTTELITISKGIPGNSIIIYQNPNPEKYSYNIVSNENKIALVTANKKDQPISSNDDSEAIIKDFASSAGVEFNFEKKRSGFNNLIITNNVKTVLEVS
ncbi:MAG: hypothetical protein J4428_04445 [Candidatus Aenigmarchaeota archaeon]|nr:hypothetical protein [Candidatus Aenigmarchaeota archaeon]